MTKSLLLFVAFAFGCSTARPPQFVYCPPAKFANCTVARCVLNKESRTYSCDCFVDDRYSATAYASTCVAATATTAQSRYHPVQSYQECTSPRTDTPLWAWCLGVQCTIGANGTSASCDCTVPPAGTKLFPYIVTTQTFLPDGCKSSPTGEVWSSATPGDVSQITKFLQQQPGLGSLQAPAVFPQP